VNYQLLNKGVYSMEVISFHAWKIRGLNVSIVQYKNNVPKEKERKKLEFERTVTDVAELYGRKRREMEKRSVCR
jgi:hypothetical protein